MSSANYFNLDQPKILSSGNGLKYRDYQLQCHKKQKASLTILHYKYTNGKIW